MNNKTNYKNNKIQGKVKNKIHFIQNIFAAVLAGIVLFVGFCGFCVPLNIKSSSLWLLIILAVAVFTVSRRLLLGFNDFRLEKFDVKPQKDNKNRKKTYKKATFPLKHYILPIILLAVFLIIEITGSEAFNATKYASILIVSEAEFTRDMSESVGTDSIALMDTASAKMLGDREIGTLSNVVSQFNVSNDYIQIDFNGKPMKVSALEYAGFFKWKNNKENGTPGYVTVDPVSMSATFNESEGMKYVPSAWFSENAKRHIWSKYPTLMFGNLHFEIDDSSNPFYVASIYDNTVSLFGGKTIVGCLVLDPVNGNIEKYDVDEVPEWVDVVFDGDLICRQYNWYGTLQNGYFNSQFGKKGCKQITEYISDTAEDNEPVADFGYVSKDGDIWIYTGITSVNGDSSNIGFLLANERTGESRFYAIAGADEKSAMSAAEGEVQEKGYQASFPSLINIDGNPTYIMVLKDSGGLVKLYAAVNVEQYNIVATASTQAECLKKYKSLLGIDDIDNSKTESKTIDVTISQIKYIDIDGYTYIYLIDTENNIYNAKAVTHENLLLLKEGDKVTLTVVDKAIINAG